jgi:hypothetical protein
MQRAQNANLQPNSRQMIISMVSAAVVERHAPAQQDRPEWFWHLLRKAETKAAKIAEQAAQSEYSYGGATFIEVYAKTLPVLLTQALERLDEPTKR